METVVLTIHLILAFGLIIVVLLQRSEGGGLGIGGAGGIMTGRGAATALSKVTWALGVLFVVTSLTLTVIAAREAGTGSVLDRLGLEAPAPATSPETAPQSGEAPATAPGLEGNLLPPAPLDGPAPPPPVE